MRETPVFGPTLGVFLSLGGVSAALTIVFLAMRAVMEIGGTCAEGGPYVIARPCPEGVAALMPLSILGGVAAAFAYVWQSSKGRAFNLIGLAWPALFLSLGWNFLEFGLNPPQGGLAWGWLVCAVAFGLMGGVPLLMVLPHLWRRAHGVQGPTIGLLPNPERAGGSAGSEDRSAERADGSSWAAGESAGTGFVEALTKLDELHRSGALDDQEYEAAKDRVLGEGE